MIMSNRFFVAASVVLSAALAFSTQAAAQTDGSPVLLVLDKDAIDYGPPPHLLPETAVNTDLAGVGVREELSYFQSHLSAQVVLSGGRDGSDAWFAIRNAPAIWSTTPGAGDGLQNFALAGPGLGSPDDEGDRESLLDVVSSVTPIHTAAFQMLVGRMACAVVYADNVTVSAGTASLKGSTLGRIAFKIVSVLPTDDPARPNVQVEIAEGHEVCAGDLAAFSEAPDEQ
jgi:hypothetical protein